MTDLPLSHSPHQTQQSLTWQVTPDLLGVLDAEAKFMQTNPAWTNTLGWSAAEIESRLFFDFIHPDDFAKTAKAFVDLQHGKPILNFENRYAHKNGSYRWLSWNTVPEGDLFICSARDVTEAKDTAESLAKSRAEGELREQFISILGHDLRNPLAGAICAVQYLDREELSDRGKIIVDTAGQSLARMSKLIDDVLDFARARLGADIGICPAAKARLKPAIEQTIGEIRMAHPDISWDVSLEFEDPFLCDPDRIAQLLSNLLGNAILHGAGAGRVGVHARDEGDALLISVTNQGAPIPPGVRALLFEPFKRAEPGSSQNGLGLGLYIARQIALRHGGDIDVRSDVRETCFTLRLPRAQAGLVVFPDRDARTNPAKQDQPPLDAIA